MGGHVFGLFVVATLSSIPEERELATYLLINFVRGIVDAGYQLIDVTGEPTTWGRWCPSMVNGHRAWSDERGLQSLQILAYLSAAANLTGPQPWIMDAYHELTNATNQYNQNLLNL